MSRIHVRSLSQFNWAQQREESDLTVPGSYWLCYRNNIYKFIFRYHRMVRNTKKFIYGKELMKVIRRIIKFQPCQGQQFCTCHLLVTYNHTSWTRQDKMFALLKFKERPDAATFTYAFVLTIKLCPSESLQIDRNDETTVFCSGESPNLNDKNFDDVSRPEIENKKSKEYLTHSPERDCSRADEQYPAAEHSLESKSGNTQLDVHVNKEKRVVQSRNGAITGSSPSNSNVCSKQSEGIHRTPVSHNLKVHNKMEESKSLRCNTFEVRMKNKECILDNKKSVLIKNKATNVADDNIMNTNMKDIKYTKIKNYKQRKPTFQQVPRENNELVSVRKELPQLIKIGSEGTSTDCKNISTVNSNNVQNDDIRTTYEVTADSVNLPYQYLIEKEIEDTKKQVSNCPLSSKKVKHNIEPCSKEIRENDLATFVDESKLKKRRLSEVSENGDNFTMDAIKNRLSPCKKKKLVKHSEATRSSDITNLVMEGLMFTIRQGQERVAVIEQKTELEMDEVLENSEKVETKEGEKRLQNSSLLRLENLVTMIEVPLKIESKHKSDNEVSQDNVSQLNVLRHTSPQDSTQGKCSKIKKSTKMESADVSKSTVQQQYCNNTLNNTSSAHRSYSDATSVVEYPEISSNPGYVEDMEDRRNKKQDVWEDFENNVPEKLQNEISQSAVFKSKQIDLLKQPQLQKTILNTDTESDTSVEDSMQHTVTSNDCNTILENDRSVMQLNTVHTKASSEHSDSTKCDSHVPRIVSVQVITVDEIPLTLQKVVRKKLVARQDTSLNENVIQTDDTEEINTHLSDEGTNGSSSQLKILTLSNGKVGNTTGTLMPQTIEESHKSVNSDVKSFESGCDKSLEDRGAKTHKTTLNKVTQIVPHKLQDITQDFYQDLHLQKTSNAITQRCLRERKKSRTVMPDVKNDETQIEMLKFIHDITRGAKVVVRRMNIRSIPNITGNSSSLTSCMH